MKLGNIDRRLFTILMIVFVQMVGAAMILPILPLYAQRRFNLSPAVITLLVSSFFAAQFLAGPFIGRLSDKYGRLPVLIVSQIGTAISFVMLAFAPNIETLFLARIFDGITGGNIIVAQAYITDITPQEQRTHALGNIFAAFGLGFILGPALGGILSAAYGIQLPFLVAALAATATVILTWFTLDETLSPEKRRENRSYRQSGLGPGEVIRNSTLVIVLIIAFVAQFAMGMIQSTFALYGEAVLFATYGEEITNLGIGLLLASVGLTHFFTQIYLIKPAVGRYGEGRLVIFGSLLRAIGLFILAVIVSPWPGVPALVVFAIGMGLMMPSLQSLATNTVADQVRGGVLGLYQSSISLATIFGTALGGVLFAITPATPYWIGGALSVMAVIPAVVLWRQSQGGRLKKDLAPSNV